MAEALTQSWSLFVPLAVLAPLAVYANAVAHLDREPAKVTAQ